jgi:hypothetical protein
MWGFKKTTWFFGPSFASFLFLRYFVNFVLFFVCAVNRRVYTKFQERVNPTFHLFVTENQIHFPDNYHQIHSNSDAHYRALAAYDNVSTLNIHEPSFEFAEMFLVRMFAPHLYGCGVLSEEAVIADINKSSSPAWPANMQCTKKSQALRDFPHVPSFHWHSFSTLEPFIPIWLASDKQELRTIKKIKKFGAEFDNNRVFTGSPFELTITGNRLCVDFNNRFYDCAGKTFSEVGASKFNGGFARLLARFTGFICWSLDLKRYDSTQAERLLIALRRIRESMWANRYKTCDNMNRLFWYYYFIINAYIATTEGELIRKKQGTTSGNGNTIVDNTLLCILVLMYTYIFLFQKRSPGETPEYQQMLATIMAAVCGDNLFLGVRPEIAEWFNAHSVAEVFLTLGLTITTDDWEGKPAQDLEFCSMTFGSIDGYVVPVCDYDKMICSLMYGSKVHDVRWDLMRAYALRIECWTNTALRNVISDYISYLLVAHGESMVGSVHLGPDLDVPMETIHSMFKSDRELFQLYTGRDSGHVELDFPSLSLIKTFSESCDFDTPLFTAF